MARPVPVCFVGPLPASLSLTKELLEVNVGIVDKFSLYKQTLFCRRNMGRHQLESALGRLTSIVTSCHTVQKVLGPFVSSDKGVLSVNRSCHHHLVAPPSFIISETQPLNLVADYCTNIVISGYWVGPDIDDGWGFVEAIINQVT